MPRVLKYSVSQSQRKLQPLHREAIFKLRAPGKGQKSLRVIAELLAAGYKGLPPVKVTEETVRATYQRMADDRDALSSVRMPNRKRPTNERLDAMVRRLIDVGERETQRIERMEARGKLDSARLLKLARALRSLYDLQERAEQAPDPDDDQVAEQPASPPSSFADSLAPPIDAGPDDLPDQDTSRPTHSNATGDGRAAPEATEATKVEPASESASPDGNGSDGGVIARTDFAPTGLGT